LGHTSEFLASFQSTLDALPLPERVSVRYEAVSELGHRPGGGVFLLRRKEDGAFFVLKIETGGQDLAEEFRLLGRLRKGLAPGPVDCFEEDGTQYLIRAYVPGQSLAEAWEADSERWIDLGVRLCGLLAELHGLEPPIVHRDIKPENIILSPEGEPYLIDFGIARSYKPERETDTVHMGTRVTAAPEQYGFAQSNPRTDLYALGVTLRWMVTGSYRPEALECADCPAWTKRFLRKAAAFDPADRYPSAEAMASVLRRHTAAGRGRRNVLALAVCLALLLGLLLCGIAQRQPVDFGSPLLEAAVRTELNKPAGDITKKDLEKVRRLAVVGQNLLGEEQDFECRLCVYVDETAQFDTPRGDVSDLSILAGMPNLTTLYLCRQEISDLTALEGLPLRELYLCDNAVSDISPLEDLPDLEVLYLGSNPLNSLTPLSSLRGLRELNLDFWEWWELEELSPLEGLPLESLSLGNLTILNGDWSVLRRLWNLEKLTLWNPPPQGVAALEGCSWLHTLNLGNYQEADLTDLPVLSHLVALNIFNCLPSIDGVQKQTSLGYLSLCNQEEVDMAPAAALPALKELYLYNVSTPGYAPLLEAPRLELVDADTEAVRAAIEADCPGRRFRIRVS